MNAVGDGTVTIDLFDVKAQYTVDGVYHRSTDDASTNSAVFQWTKTKNGKSSDEIRHYYRCSLVFNAGFRITLF